MMNRINRILSLGLAILLAVVAMSLPVSAATAATYVTELEDGAQYRLRNADTGKYLTFSNQNQNVYQYDYLADGTNQIITYQERYNWGLSKDCASLGLDIYFYAFDLAVVGGSHGDNYDSWTIEFLPDGRAVIWNDHGGFELGAIGMENGDNGWFQVGDICLNVSGVSTDYIYWYFEKVA